MICIVGLGNIGQKYDHTRHNIGFNSINYIAQKLNFVDFKLKEKYLGYLSSGEYKEKKVYLLKPNTYMNLSGKAVNALTRNIKTNCLIVIQDDIDLDIGTVRLKTKGTSGGHNGIASIIELFGENFYRIKIGISRPEKNIDVRDYVLQKFKPKEQEQMLLILDKAYKMVLDILDIEENK